jgi:hypothetical protein
VIKLRAKTAQFIAAGIITIGATFGLMTAVAPAHAQSNYCAEIMNIYCG